MKKIVEGIYNTFNKKQDVEQLAAKRLAICTSVDKPYKHCRNYNPYGTIGAFCEACGCTLKFKTRSVESKCPIGKW